MSTHFPADPHLGAVERTLELDGRLKLPAGGLAPAHLCLSDRGLWLADWSNPKRQVQRDLLAGPVLAYEVRTLGDVLVVDGKRFGIPRGKGSAAQEMIAVARLRSGRALGPSPLPGVAPLLEPRTVVEETWLRTWLRDDETLLAWLASSTKTRVEGPMTRAPLEGPARFVLTTRRAAVVAIAPLGDVKLLELREVPLGITPGVTVDTMQSSDVRWETTYGNRSAYAFVAELPGKAEADRLFTVAERTWLEHDGGLELIERAKHLLECLHATEDPRSTVALYLMGELHSSDGDGLDQEGEAALRQALARLLEEEGSAVDLVDLCVRWRVAADEGRILAELLTSVGTPTAKDAAVDLLERLRAPIVSAVKSLRLLCEHDLDHAQRLVAAGRRDEACALLEARLLELPQPEVLELLALSHPSSEGPPGAEPDGTRPMHAEPGGTEPGENGFVDLRVRMLAELMMLRSEVHGELDLDTVAELARLQPLSLARVSALAELATGDLSDRARHVVSLLDGSADLGHSADGTDANAIAPLSLELIEGCLKHPAAREGHLLGKLQSMLARVEVPDHSALRGYCERLTSDASPPGYEALADAVVALGVPGVQAYVSRGDRATGVRAYEGSPSFLLIGGDHLDPASSSHLSPRELRFAVAAEVAHLRYQHARVTSEELWSGLLDKGKSTIDAALSVLPFIGAFRWGQGLARIAGRLDKIPLGAAMGLAGKVFPKGASSAGAVGVDTTELLAAHRVMQFTADRAGLLLSGNVHASVRAMLLTSMTLRAELPVIERVGLRDGLLRRDEDGALIAQSLAVRVCALLSFYLHDDYAALAAQSRA